MIKNVINADRLPYVIKQLFWFKFGGRTFPRHHGSVQLSGKSSYSERRSRDYACEDVRPGGGVWRIAFHDRLGLNACRWQDCTEVPLYNVVINGRHRKEVQASVPEEDAQLGLDFA